jgi:hypothetical protein
MKNITRTHLEYYSPNNYAVATHPNMQQYATTEQNSSSKISSEMRPHVRAQCPIFERSYSFRTIVHIYMLNKIV